MSDGDDDFQIPLTQTKIKNFSSPPPPLQFSNRNMRPAKKPKRSVGSGKENVRHTFGSKQEIGSVESLNTAIHRDYAVSDLNKRYNFNVECSLSSIESVSAGGNAVLFEPIENKGFRLTQHCSLDAIESSIDCSHTVEETSKDEEVNGDSVYLGCGEKGGLKSNGGYLLNSIESRLVNSRIGCGFDADNGQWNGDDIFEEFEGGSQLDVLLKLCSEVDEKDNSKGSDCQRQDGDGLDNKDGVVCCPICGLDISDLSGEQRLVHTNDCLDNEENHAQDALLSNDDRGDQFLRNVVYEVLVQSPQKAVGISPVREWLCSLGLERFEKAFVREEIDWDTLQTLTEEDLFSIGVTALGPRKKIVHALSELRKWRTHTVEIHKDSRASSEPRKRSTHVVERNTDASEVLVEETSKLTANKLITDYFPGSVTDRKKVRITSSGQHDEKSHVKSSSKRTAAKDHVKRGKKLRDIPSWCCIPGTSFRVDAFRYLRRDCSHWFLTHFHMDHYQGLTRSFCHGKIYCSLITAKLVNMKIGIPWDRLEVLPLNQKISISGIDVMCLDANHCPGSIIILFEPPNGKAVLHTGDFRFSDEMASVSALQMCPIHTLILDTTYCNPQYDFPKQEAVIQFVIEAIQAEAFNPKTLFLIGSYTIGKERLFLEVARVLRKKVYVTTGKQNLLKCLGFTDEDMQWFTLNEQESHIHVVPMWTLASFKRLKHLSNQYADRFSLIVAFSPTGWTFGKGKKKSLGRRLQQGTIIRYEVPYSEHCSFAELKEFVKFVSPTNIIPSVNNDGLESANAMISLLLS